MRRALAIAAVVLALGLAGAARAQPAPAVDAQIQLLETQPADLDKGAWREARREAAKKLGQSKERRAVPALIRVADAETFDIVGKNAIEALGQIGDPAAVPELQKIAADASRDRDQRDAAKTALAKLGAKVEATAPATSASTATATATAQTTSASTAAAPSNDATADAGTTAPPITEGALLSGAPAAGAGDLPPLPPLDERVLAAYDRLTFAAGDANLSYDTVRKRVDVDGTVAGAWSHRVETAQLAYGWDANATVGGSTINAQGASAQRGAQVVLGGDGEVRGYRGPGYLVGKAAVSAQEDYVSDVDANGNTAAKDTAFQGDAQLALGVGYGRVLDVGAKIRVRRLAAALQANRALGKPIDDALARRLQLTWWALRGERTSYRALLATVAILREAGVLLAEPDAGLAYEILNALRDPQLTARPVGLDLQLAFGEGYLRRPDDAPSEHGRLEELLALASYGRELDDDKLQLTGSGSARYRLFAPDGTPAPWAVGVGATATRYLYAEHGDPLGALDATLTVALSDDDVMTGDTGLAVTGALGFTYWLNQASGLRLAATATVDQGQLFLGAQFSATYGLLDGTVAR